MPKISLGCYSLRVKNIHTGDYLILNKIESEDLFDLLRLFLKQLSGRAVNDQQAKRMIRSSRQHPPKVQDRTLSGLVETGGYGFESELIDSNKGTTAYKRNVNDAELFPYFFLFSIPPKKDKGIVILQRFGQFGLSRALHSYLDSCLQRRYRDLRLELNPLISKKVVNQILQGGSILKVVFTRFDIPPDLADYFETRDSKQVQGHCEFRIVAKKNHGLPLNKVWLKKLLGDGKKDGLIEISQMEYQNVRLQVRYKRDTRTIDLSDLESMRAYHDVTDNVKLQENGHPCYESIDSVSRDLLQDMNHLLYPGQHVDQD